MSVAKSLCSEALGTMILLATIIGSGIMAESLSGGNVAIALLGNTLPTGAMLMVLITLFGPVSGAHFNPVVTAAFWMRGEITLPLAIGFICVQSVGGIAGSWLAHLMFEQPILQFSDTSRSGLAQYFSEFIATSGLLLVIFLPMHFWVLSLAVSDADRLALFLEMTHNPVVKLAETVLVGLLAVHFFGGMRLMAFEWFGWPAYQKTAAAAVLSVAIFIAMLFLFRTL